MSKHRDDIVLKDIVNAAQDVPDLLQKIEQIKEF